eukprot:gene5942-2505_t
MMYFPNSILTVSIVFLQGTARALGQCFYHYPPGWVAFAVVIMLVFPLFVVAYSHWYTTKRVNKGMQYAIYVLPEWRVCDKKMGDYCLPHGRWVPDAIAQRWGVMFMPYNPRRKYFVVFVLWYYILLGLVSALDADTISTCYGQ